MHVTLLNCLQFFSYEKWAKNKEKIDEHNLRYAQGLEKYTEQVYKHHDMSDEEFQSARLGVTLLPSSLRKNQTVTMKRRKLTAATLLPASVDWRNKTGAIGPVKDQGACGLA